MEMDLIDKDGTLFISVRMHEGNTTKLEITGSISYRFTLSELYLGIVNEGWDKLLVLKEPAWLLGLSDEDSSRGEFVRRRHFFHLDISDVGVLECYALEVHRL